ncbi:MAG: arylsulfatase [Ruminococcaceae bacterium]|nr:arylsulfatase [Oscillospiraceae bacterium]
MKPNIIIINPDQMRADSLHHLGNEAAYTPNLDELSYEGVSFSNAFCQNPVCVPSRCSFMTGLYPHTMGHRTMSNLLKPYEENLFSDMKKAGYYTMSTTRGDLMAGQYKKYHKDLIDKYLMFRMSSERACIPKANRGEKGSDTYNSFFDGITEEKKSGKAVKNTDDFSVDTAIREIKHRPKNKPFFMFIGLNFPHPPYSIEKKYYDLIDPDKLQKRIPSIADTDGKPKMETGLRNALGVYLWDEERLKEIRRVYLAMCAKVDDQIGRIREALKKEGIYDETAIVILSDHGDYTGDYGIVEKCQNCFPDCLTNVPFIVKPAKNIKADTGINDNLVELTDLCATVYDLAEIKCTRQSFSRSTLPTIKDKNTPHRDYVFSEGGRLLGEKHCSEMNLFINENDRYAPRQLLQNKEDGTHTKAAMIRTKEYKYVLRLYENDEFYELVKGESKNLINEDEYEEKISELKEKMLLWYMKTSDIVPTSFDDRFTDEFLQNNIVSFGIPPVIAKTFTRGISLTGKTASQFIDIIRKKLNV